MANAAPVVSYDNAAEASRYLGIEVPADARAFFLNGEVHIIADQIGSKRDLAEAIVHEQLRHHGFKALLGKSYRATMKDAWSNRTVREMARDLFMNQGYKDIEVFNEDGSIKSGATISQFNHAADEAIAHLADQGWKSGLMDRIGDYYVRAVDADGKTIYREHFDMLFASTDEKRKSDAV